jgi:uncharacterized protein with PIN domain
MGVQLSIKHAEARSLAFEVAKRSCQSVLQAVIEAFRKRKHELTKEERMARKLNDGDCLAYALEIARNAPLVFEGHDFAQTAVCCA